MKLLALPRDGNPYQERLYGELRARGWRARYAGDLTPSGTLNLLLLPLELLVRRAFGWRILHVHWVWGFALPLSGRVPVLRRVARAWFEAVLRLARLAGIHVVWTAHNVLPHARVFDDDAAARRALVDASDLVIAHSDQALADVAALGVAPRRAAVVPLAPEPTALPSRAAGEGPGPRRVLFFGRIEAYKGVEELLRAFALLPATTPLELTVAGQCRDRDLRARLETLAGSGMWPVRLRLEHVSDEELRALLAAADAVVLPFRSATTSSSAVMAASCARPLIVSDLPAFAGLPAIRYDGTVEALAGALGTIASEPGPRLAARGTEARAAVGGTTWADAAERIAEALADLGSTRAGARLRALTGDAIYRGSLLLLANTVLLSLFGFAFWTLAAHTYPTTSVGAFAGVSSAVTLLATVAALGLPNTIVRHLAAAPEARELLAGVLAAVGALGGALALTALVALPLHAKAGGAPLLAALVVVTATSAATDAGLIALRSVRAVLMKNLAGSVLKVAALVPLSGLGTTGLVLAFAAGAALSTALGAVALWRRTPAGHGPRAGVARLLRRYGSFSLGSYVGTIFGILPLTGLPLLVIAIRGTHEAAWFAAAILPATFLNFIPSTAAQVLFAEASRGERGLGANVRTALRGIYALLLPAVVLLVLGAPLILRLFGIEYAHHATDCLRLLALGAVFTGGTYVVDAILAARDRVLAYVAMNAVNAALVLGLVAWRLPAHGLTGAAEGWVAAQALSLAAGALLLVGLGEWRPARGLARRRAIGAGRARA